jgi:general secretion pathway protein J
MNERGFTLIEVLVALAITALVAVLVYGGLSSAIAAGESTRQEAERLRTLDRLFQLLQRDITQAVKRPVRNRDGERQAAFSGGVAGDALLLLTRGGWPNSRQQQRSDLQRVRYRWDGSTLWRDYWLHTDRGPLEEPISTPLATDLKAVRLRFLDGSAGSAAVDSGQWRPSWLAREAGDRLPAAVEVVVELQAWGEVRRLFVLPAND